MKRLSFLAALAAMTLSGIGAYAGENEFSIDAQFRNRGEFRSGVLNSTKENVTPSAFINERARLGVSYKNDWLTVRFAGQHTGVWGQTKQNPTNNGDFNINEAWAQIGFGDWYLKMGRQSLVYDDERILGGLDWHIAGRSHDVAKLGYVSPDKKQKFDLMAAFNQSSANVAGSTYYDGSGQPYKTMLAGWYHFDVPGDMPFSASILAMNLGFESGDAKDPDQVFKYTFGTYITLKPGIFTVEGSFYYQSGKTQADKTISAYMFALKGTAKFNKIFSASAGIDYLSGQNDSDNCTSFDPLYGTHHKFYGLIDYWYINRAASEAQYGLVDPYVGVNVNAGKKLGFALTGHCFFSQSDGGLECYKAKGDYRATEIDLQLTYKLRDCVTLMGGYSAFIGGKDFYCEKSVLNDNANQNWVWLQLNIAPKLFSSRR